MALITFLSDFGERDHYVAAVKAKVFSIDQSQKIIDITHSIEPYNTAHGAYVLKSIFKEFPEGTVHMIGVNSIPRSGQDYIAVEIEGHYFVGTDNGLLSLISEKKPSKIVKLKDQKKSLFPVKDVFVEAACELANRGKLESLGESKTEMNRMIGRELRITDSMIMGNVIHIDHYGNLIINIDKSTFEATCAQREYTIKFAREGVKHLNEIYHDVDEGDVSVTFNSLGYLEIAIVGGNASQLLGLKYDSPVIVSFS